MKILKSNFRFGVLLVTVAIIQNIYADVYLHNPRGGNNRLDEENRNRNNANRMFDSQNNGRGGYNVGSVFYHSGSVLQVEWTNQHSCQNPNSHCELILQYMCEDLVRDGASTKTIPTDQAQCANGNCNTDKEYGMNENYEYYLNCMMRQRNKGLFTADQNLNPRNRQTARNTRQNPNGNRYGYECPEERDYYPYWQPSPWKDIAIMTNNATRCPFYKAESQNVKSRWTCVIPDAALKEYKGQFIIPNNRQDCEDFRYPENDAEGVQGVWTEIPAHNIPAPDCRETEFTRDNHLGNGLNGHPNLYNWTVPNTIHERCVMRLRYNISTNDYDGWNTSYNTDVQQQLSDRFGFANKDAADDRGYVFEGNPEVQVFEEADFQLQLAINTAQYGRTFQDRSFTFAIRPRPAGTEGHMIHNLNVRGKRGNIVQVYPSVEYDFVPNNLEMSADDFVHIQWTGSNTNNANNDGNGQARSDRNNMVLLAPKVYSEGNGAQLGPGQTFGHYGRNYPVHVANSSLLGLGRDDLLRLAFTDQFGGELSQLDDAGTYFNMGPRQINSVGTFHYMSTRNNDFTNRDQKGRITVFPHLLLAEAIGWSGGQLALPDNKANVMVEQGDFASLQSLRIEEWTVDQAMARVRQDPAGDDYASNFVYLSPESKLTMPGKTITVEMKIDPGANNVAIYRSSSTDLGTWTKMDAQIAGDTASFEVDQGGVYIARQHNNIGPIIGIVVAAVVLALVVVSTIVYLKKNPGKWQKMRNKAKYVERSVQNKV